jgi:AcrR family transcriptional regulator
MVRPKQMSDKELLEIALECFLEHGANVSAQVIADKVGISQPALFKRFGTKEELFLQAVVPSDDFPVIEWIDASPSSDPFQPQLVQMLEQVWEMLKWVMPRVRLLRESRLPRGTAMSRYKTPPPVMLIRSIAGFIERAQEQGLVRPNLNPQFVSQWIFGALMGQFYLSETIGGKINLRDNTPFIKSTVDFLVHGIKPMEE